MFYCNVKLMCYEQNYFISEDTPPSKPAKVFYINLITMYGRFLVSWFTFQSVCYQPSDYLLCVVSGNCPNTALVYLFRITLAFQPINGR